MTDPNPRRYSFAESSARRYAEAVEGAARRLDDLAADTRRHASAERSPMVDDQLSHVQAAQRIVHAVAWGLANLNLDGLISDAQVADYARRVEDGDV